MTPPRPSRGRSAGPARGGRGKRAAAPPVRALRAQVRDQARDAYRASILEAAERVFLRAGYFEAKVADIARDAGIAAGTLYNYFDSKEHIYDQLCAWRHEQGFAAMRDIAARPEPPLERIAALVRWMLGEIEAHEPTFRLVVEMSGEMGDLPPSRCADAMLERRRAVVDLFERLAGEAQQRRELRRDVAASDLCVALLGVLKAYIQAWMIGPRRGRGLLSERAPLVMDLFLSGAAPR
jgi:TetR/AcrR family fatty acid metabolism transcriptional regulator